MKHLFCTLLTFLLVWYTIWKSVGVREAGAAGRRILRYSL